MFSVGGSASRSKCYSNYGRLPVMIREWQALRSVIAKTVLCSWPTPRQRIVTRPACRGKDIMIPLWSSRRRPLVEVQDTHGPMTTCAGSMSPRLRHSALCLWKTCGDAIDAHQGKLGICSAKRSRGGLDPLALWFPRPVKFQPADVFDSGLWPCWASPPPQSGQRGA